MEEADEPPLSLPDRIRSSAKSSALDTPPYDTKQHPNQPPSAQSISGRYVSDWSSPSSSSKQSTRRPRDQGGSKSHDGVPPDSSTATTVAGPPLSNTQDASEKHSPLVDQAKPDWPTRMKAGSIRFIKHTKNALYYSYINVLLIFVPIGIAVNFAPLPESSRPTIIFALNAVAIIPLAGLLAHATEVAASSMGDSWAALLNVTFGNAVELIIFIIALTENQIRIVQASIIGSILANLLLILGMAFLLGGLRFREQIYNNTVTQMSACLLSLSVSSLLLPTAFHASFADIMLADFTTLKISRGTSVILLFVYVLYLLFQLKSHAYMYVSTPQHIIDEESHPGVLADMLNSSSSDSSSSSSDSDSSLGSHATAKKRFTRAVRKRIRRKSSTTNSSHTASPPGAHSPLQSPMSALSSVHGDRRSALDESILHLDSEYFGQPMQQRHERSGVLSGDEADTDGEHDARDPQPHVRDFEVEHVGSESNTLPHYEEKRKDRHKKKREKKAKRSIKSFEKQSDGKEMKTVQHADTDRTLVPTSPQEPIKPRVNFSIETDQTTTPDALTSSSRRNFARQISRPNFRAPPPLTNLLSNTVFTTPAPTRPANANQAVNLSVARRTGGLRRTSSLPDRLNGPGVSGRATSSTGRGRQAEQADRFGMLVTSEADAARKDAATDGGAPAHEKPVISRTAAIVMLIISTALVAFCAELLVEEIPLMVENTSVSQSFIGLIILPIVGNAAEHVTAVTVATKNKMDLSIGVAVGSSIQIALFVTPFIVLLGWAIGKEMTLYFNLFETVSVFVTAFVINFLILDGRSNYLEGALLIAAYLIIALAAFFFPDVKQRSQLGGV